MATSGPLVCHDPSSRESCWAEAVAKNKNVQANAIKIEETLLENLLIFNLTRRDAKPNFKICKRIEWLESIVEAMVFRGQCSIGVRCCSGAHLTYAGASTKNGRDLESDNG
jgi:hypothetical protein